MNVEGAKCDRHVLISRRQEFGKINNPSEMWQGLKYFDTSNQNIWNKPTLHLRINEEQIEFRECLLQVSSEFSPSAKQNCEY